MSLTAKNTGMDVAFIEEVTRGTLVTTGQLYRVSDAIENVSLRTAAGADVLYSVYDYDGQGTIYGQHDYTLSFDYYLQRTKTTTHPLANTMEYYALTRTSGLLKSLTATVNTESASSFHLAGGVVNRLSMTLEEKRIRCHAELIFKSCVTTGTYTYTAATAIGTTFEQFQGATITRSGSFNAGVSGFSLEINNNTKSQPVVGASQPTAIYESLQNVGGSVDILVNNGGETDFYEVDGQYKTSIVFNTGTSAVATDCSEVFTIANATFTELPIDFTTDTTVVIAGARYVAESISLASKT
jgi:hypothetical protein